MHIIIAAITAVAGLLWALNSLQNSGFDLNSLNPFYWARRRAWEKKQINPLYAIESPRELAAVLMFATQKLAGDPTTEEKAHLLDRYTQDLQFSAKEADEMYLLASHLLNIDPNYMHKANELLAPAMPHFTSEQRAAIPELVAQVASFSGTANAAQADFTDAVTNVLVAK